MIHHASSYMLGYFSKNVGKGNKNLKRNQGVQTVVRKIHPHSLQTQPQLFSLSTLKSNGEIDPEFDMTPRDLVTEYVGYGYPVEA